MAKIAFIETDNPEDWTLIEADNPAIAIADFFGGSALPENTKIYDNEAFANSNDITPHTFEQVADLAEHEGPLYVKSYPGEPITIIAIVVGIVAAVAVTLLVTLPTPTARNTQSESPNNALSARTNRARPNARIPDPFGTVRSVPDLLSTYSVYENHTEIEYSYMCIGRGEYLVEADNVFDGDTPILEINGASVSLYDPFTSPISGDAPYLQIGGAISEDIYIVHKSNAVNGQTLLAANDANVRGRNNIAANSTGFITTEDSNHIFSNEFSVGDTVIVENGVYGEGGSTSTTVVTISSRFSSNNTIEAETPSDFASYNAGDQIAISDADFIIFVENTGGGGGGNRKPGNPLEPLDDLEDYTREINLDGTYEIQSVSGGVITLVNPSAINSDWNYLTYTTIYRPVKYSSATMGFRVDLSGTYEVDEVTSSTLAFTTPDAVNAGWTGITTTLFGITFGFSPVIYRSSATWEGPFVINELVTLVVANFTANQGLFKDDGEDQIAASVQVELEITPIDENGGANGAVITRTGIVVGSKDSRSLRALTMKVNLASETRVSVRARRITALDLTFEGSVVDEVKFKTLYGMARPSESSYGNVTTVHSKTIATEGALAVKERKLNMIVTRKVPLRISGTTFTAPEPTTYAADIFTGLCLDPEIGGLEPDELDLDSIYGAVATVRDYFGSTDYVSFSYTFDNDNLSLQESLQVVSKAVFCQDYRQSDKIRLSANIATDDSRILFNHRNKVPLSEERTDRFGILDDVDGLEVEWVDPKDDSITTFYIPEDRTASKPRNVETIGIRNPEQVHAFAWRTWYRLKHENGGTKFQATQEAELLVPTNRILSADNTRNTVQDGEIVSQTGLVLETSQEVVFEDGKSYWAHLQHIDGTMEPISISPGEDETHIVLSRAPKAPLSLDEDAYARATYLITDDATGRHSAFQVSSVRGGGDMTAAVEAVRYSPIYYINDGLLYWLRDGLKDYGPKSLSSQIAGAVAEVSDADRGLVISSPSGSQVATPTVVKNGSFTIALWVKGASGSSRIYGTDGETVSLSASGGNVVFKSGGATLSGGAINSAVWSHIVVSYSSDTGITDIYVNGSHKGEASLTIGSISSPYFIGDNSTAGTYDDVRYYARALSIEDAAALYNLTRGS